VSKVDQSSQPPNPSGIEALPSLVGDFVQKAGSWPTLDKLEALPPAEQSSLIVKGLKQIVQNLIVRELLVGQDAMAATPRLTPDFLEDFERFDLTAKEGYLVSLIDGRSPLRSILKLSPLDAFATLFAVAKLEHKKVVTIPS